MAGIRLCPPASGLASSPCSARAATTSSSESGRRYRKTGGFTTRRPTAWIAWSTLVGVMGVSTMSTSNSANASATALAMAAAGPIVPDSPTPFTPQGVVADGVSRCSMVIDGISRLLGTV